MVLKAFAVFDVKADAFMAPVFMPAVGLMVRAFQDAVNQSGHDFAKHPEDYRLAQVGTFDDASGMFQATVPVEWLGFGTQYVREVPRDVHGIPRDG